MKLTFTAMFLAILMACQLPPPPIPHSYMTEATACVTQISQSLIAKYNNNRVNFVDSRDAMLSQIVVALIERDQANPYGACFAGIEAYYRAHGVVVTANSAIVQSVFNTAQLPLTLLAGGKALDWVMESAGTTTITADRSDILVDSGNKGTGNVTGRSGEGINVNQPTDDSVDNTDNSTDDSVDNTDNRTDDSDSRDQSTNTPDNRIDNSQTNSNNVTNDPPPP